MHEGQVTIPDVPLFFICGCCKQAIEEDSEGVYCPNCKEYVCEPSASCQALCKCDRGLRGRITQMWFRKLGELTGFYYKFTSNGKKVGA